MCLRNAIKVQYSSNRKPPTAAAHPRFIINSTSWSSSNNSIIISSSLNSIRFTAVLLSKRNLHYSSEIVIISSINRCNANQLTCCI